MKKIYENYNNNYQTLIDKEKAKLNDIENTITQISKKIDKIYFDNLNGMITNDDYFRYSKGFIEERERLKKEKINTKNNINILKEKQASNKNTEEIENTIEEFLKMQNPSKQILYELIDRIELDEYKNIYIYFNFSELNIINEELEKLCIIKIA